MEGMKRDGGGEEPTSKGRGKKRGERGMGWEGKETGVQLQKFLKICPAIKHCK